MTDSTTPQDGNAMPPASDGSVGEPVAYGVVYPDGTTGGVGWRWEDCLEVAGVSDVIVPLYRHPSPTLTDTEREAVETCIADDEAMTHHSRAAILRGLLERLK